jgi:triacylglycerol lipase
MSVLTQLPTQLYDPKAFAAFSGDVGFSLGTGRAMMWMSQLAYETDDQDKICSVLQQWGLALNVDGIIVKEAPTVLPLASTHLFVANGRGSTFIAFAGTDPLVSANWISDFDVHLSSTDTAQGFTDAAEIVWPQIEAAISVESPNAKSIFVTGHSLGGALAALTAKNIADSGRFSLTAVYTYGMPRVGDQNWHQQYSEKLGQRSYRMVYGQDPVPSVPPSSFPPPSTLEFRHVGRLLACENGGKFDGAKLAADSESDAPAFEQGIASELKTVSNAPVQSALSTRQRLLLAARIGLGFGPSSMRSDPGAVAADLLPPRLRDHLPDRYISAF